MQEHEPLQVAVRRPPGSLAAYVEHICRVRGPAPALAGTCYPKHHAELVLRLEGAFEEIDGSGQVRPVVDDGWVAGPRSVPLHVIGGPGIATLFVIRTRIAGLPLISPVPPVENVDALVSVREFGRRSPRLLLDGLRRTTDWETQFQLVCEWLESRLIGLRAPLPPKDALLLHRSTRAATTTDALLRALDIAPRALNALFRGHAGCAPRQWLGMARFNRALGILAAGGSIRDLLGGDGYYDQPQVTRDFQRRAGITPGMYVRDVAAGRVDVAMPNLRRGLPQMMVPDAEGGVPRT